MSAPLVLRMTDVTAGYSGKRVIDSLSIDAVRGGQVTALVGPNGAGKSTLLRALAGLLPASGSIRVNGTELVGATTRQRAQWITFMPQTLPQRVGLTVLEGVLSALRASPLEDLGFASSSSVERRALSALERIGIDDLAMRPLDELSGGERQLASLAQSVVREPRVLLLDEPTSALDLKHQVTVMRLIRDLAADGRIVVTVLHDLNLAARWADQVVVLHSGRVAAAGAPPQSLTTKILADVYGVDAAVGRDRQERVVISVEGLIE